MNFGDIKRQLVRNRKSIDKGLDAAGGLAKKRFGANPKIDQGIDKAKDFLDKQAGDPPKNEGGSTAR